MFNFEQFVAKRLTHDDTEKCDFTLTPFIVKIAIISIALSVTIMIISISVGVGIQDKIREKVSELFGHIQITAYENIDTYTTSSISKDQVFYPDIKKLNVEGVTSIQAYCYKAGIIKNDKTFEGVILKGVDSIYNFSFLEKYLQEGHIPRYTEEYNDSVLISSYIAKNLELKLGDKFNMFFLRKNKTPIVRIFKVSGIFKTDFSDYDKTFVFADIKHVQRLNKWKQNEISGFEVFIDDFDKLDEIGLKVYKGIGADLNSTTIAEKQRFIIDWIKLFDINIAVILIIMILVSGVNMVTVLIILILERIKFIAVMKTIGCNNSTLRRIFFFKSTYIILRGLIFGNIIGIGLLLAQSYFEVIDLNPDIYYVDTIPISFNLYHVFLVNISTMFFCLLLMFFPTYMISKVNPMKILRFD
ncbi:ABC transporter permease [Ichthyobacterium seriolicida]|uniref:ABC transporter, permease protein n=1 Tax=Ichthyobacterium seriolicida TaxID=242600 RepID=A0A1J1DZY8_9FLAO|nr:FtsX-like permease family protein [Ichthyobacterium seriolicida]BAV94245.1 ABC transporter, permease protein [Ichthyobacterium seriolicida]